MVTVMFRRPKRLGSAGDTIVEVLIAVGIVSLVLTSGFAVTSRNAAAGQKTQEQTNALKLVERQSELFLASETKPSSFPVCFDGVNSFVDTSSALCLVDASGNTADSTVDTGAQYRLSITEVTTPSYSSYVVNAEWETLGDAKANVSTYVRRTD